MAHTTGPWHTPDEEAVIFAGRPNDRLIAAAPDLLAALRFLSDVTERTYENRYALDAARAAIARATGEAQP